MSVFDRLIVRGRSVFKMNAAPETAAAGVPDGTLRLYTDEVSGRQYIQTFSRSVGTNGAWETFAPAAALPPTDGDYLVGTANAVLSSEIVVGTTPGGELGGTWASPTVDSVHASAAGAHVTNGDSHDHSGGDGAQVDHGGLSGLADDDHTQYLNETRHTALSGEHVANGDGHAHFGGDGAQIAHSSLSGTGSADGHVMNGDSHNHLGGDGGTIAHASLSGTSPASSEHVTNGDSHNHDGGDGGTIAHSSLSGVGASDHHAESHTVASHSDTTATGAELSTLTDGSNADSLHTHTLGIGTLVHSSDSETGPMTSSSAADAVAVIGLSIPAAHGIILEFNYRYDNPVGASRGASFGFEINTTEVHAPDSPVSKWYGGATNQSTEGNGTYRVHVPPRATNYDRGGSFELMGAVMSDGATPLDASEGLYHGALCRDASAPVATVTSLTIRYRCITVSADEVELYINNIRVWELPD